MSIYELINTYELERNQPPSTINHILDHYQKKYITGEIELDYYRDVYHYLSRQGAISAYEYD